ncbi:unnamed protein product [Peniophora sp. CBMAI 1063]|nr:unnamed protein product [Peniophora sp. CBMAI 1063]
MRLSNASASQRQESVSRYHERNASALIHRRLHLAIRADGQERHVIRLQESQHSSLFMYWQELQPIF